MAAAENKAVITTFVEEVINQGQLERVDDLVAVDFAELDPLPGQQQGREGLKQVISAFRTAFPDIHWVIEETVGEGDKVFSRFTWRGTHRGEFFGVPATGKQISVKGMVVDRVVAGKMVESRILMRWMALCAISAKLVLWKIWSRSVGECLLQTSFQVRRDVGEVW
jgi:steroid delta-isomerase-like uncharacterized protein